MTATTPAMIFCKECLLLQHLQIGCDDPETAGVELANKILSVLDPHSERAR